MANRVNVIVPCYNSESTIKRCLDSVFNGDYKSIFVICVNDGSSDDTEDILDGYSKTYPNIVVIHKENGGPSSARNAALDYIFEKSFDGYITFIDSDDYVDRDYFSTLVNKLEESNSDIVCSSFYYSHINKESKAFELGTDMELSSYEALLFLFEDRVINSMSHHKLFNASLWNDVRYPNDLFFLEDTATIFKTFIKSKKVLLTSYAGYHYNQDNNSIIRNNNSNAKILSGWKALEYINEYNYGFNEKQNTKIMQKTINLFADNYLELYPRINLKKDKDEILATKKYVRSHKIIQLFKTRSRKQKTKRISYLLFPCFYRPLFRIYLWITNNEYSK